MYLNIVHLSSLCCTNAGIPSKMLCIVHHFLESISVMRSESCSQRSTRSLFCDRLEIYLIFLDHTSCWSTALQQDEVRRGRSDGP